MKSELKLGFKTKHYLLVYQNNRFLDDLSKEKTQIIIDYIELYPYSKLGNVWLDTKNDACFSRYQFRKTDAGKDHHFVLPRDKFLKGGFWSAPYSSKVIEKYKFGKTRDYTVNTELVSTKHKKILDNKNESVLIISGGPSVNEIAWEKMHFDQIWTCNQFYLNEKVKKQKIDLVTVVPGLFDYVTDDNFVSLIKKNDTIVSFELERGNPIAEIDAHLYKKTKEFYKKYPDNTAFFHTRYCSVLGVGPRLVVYAALTGFKKIYIIGVDGRSKVETDGNLLHAFNGDKSVPNWYNNFGDSFQERQMIIFWEYLIELSEKMNFDFYNLGEGGEYNVLSELFGEHYPLPKEMREKLK